MRVKKALRFEHANVPSVAVIDHAGNRWVEIDNFVVSVGPGSNYKCSFFSPINGRKSMGNWGEKTLLIGVITPFITSRGPTLWWQLKYFWNFHPEPWGNLINLTVRIFFNWVGEKPPTR